MTIIYRKALAPARKPYRMRLLLTHKNGDFRVVSGNEAKLRRPDLESAGSILIKFAGVMVCSHKVQVKSISSC